MPGEVAAACGQAAYDYLVAALDAAREQRADAIVTTPINKKALQAAGIKHPGHTEILTELTGSPRSCMLQYSEEITASFRDLPLWLHRSSQIAHPGTAARSDRSYKTMP